MEFGEASLVCHGDRLDCGIFPEHAAGLRAIPICSRRMAQVPQPRERAIADCKGNLGVRLVGDLLSHQNLHQLVDRTDAPPRKALSGRDRRAQDLLASVADFGCQHGGDLEQVHEQSLGHVDHMVQHRVPSWIFRIRGLGAQRELATVSSKPLEEPWSHFRR